MLTFAEHWGRKMGQRLGWLLALAVINQGISEAAAETRDETAHRAFQRGAFSEAADDWQRAAEVYHRQGNVNSEIETKLNLAATYQALGQQRKAVQLLEEAVGLAEKAGERSQLIRAKNHLGAALLMTQQPARAEPILRESLELARAQENPRLTAAVLNNLGNLLLSQQKRDEALQSWEESATLARRANDPALAAQALCNAAAAAARYDLDQKAQNWNLEAAKEIERLENSHQKGFLLLTAGQTELRIKASAGADSNGRLLRAQQLFQRAREVAEAIKDRQIESYALGYLGQLYEQDKQPDYALALTRRANFVAQQAQLPEAQYRWEWQAGRLLATKGDIEQAIAGYRRAMESVQPIRQDISLGYGNASTHGSFREALGSLYFELADLLLRQADREKDPKKLQQLLVEARDTVEQLKAVELEDYFQDDCVNVVRSRSKSLESVDPQSAVIYLIPLASRTEILVGLPGGIHRFTAKIGVEALTAEVQNFRRNLETRTTHGYLVEARELYDWIIRPMHSLLEEQRINTLVFVPDGALQAIPFASLHDGKQFLIQEFAVAVSPGLSLLEPRPIHRTDVRLLLTGLSESVQGFPSLDFVPEELRDIAPVYKSETLLNGEFVMPALTEKLTQEQFSMVHIASHGQFDRDARKTFVLTYDGKLTLNDLESLIRPSQYRGQPVELLVLSACQTAAGDDRAALGLAGIAVKAGARSALASLWFVNDQSTAVLVSEVYQELRKSSSISKARALQAAQVKMLGDRRYRHPCYWAPYLIIGNWL